MTPKRKKILAISGISIVAGLLLLVAASLLVMQTQWFSDFVRAKIIAVLEDSTGGKAEIGSFRFDPTHLTVRIQNFVLHGTEPKNASPLAQIRYLELRLKLFSGLKKAVDLAYLQADEPKVNIIVNPDGTTNVPSPKVPSAPSSTSPLATIIDLAIGQFQLNRGSLSYSQTTTPFALQGDNLHALLNFNSLNQSYLGNVEIAALTVTQGKNPPLAIHVNLPVTISRDTVSLANAHLSTASSDIAIDAALQDLKSPKISAKVHAKVALTDIQPSLKNGPGFLIADLDAHVDQPKNIVELRTLHVSLGGTALDASGTANPTTGGTIQFNGDLALAELVRLADLASPQIAGNLNLKGTVALDSQRNYNVNGTLASQNLSLKDGDTRLSNVSLSAPFHVDPSEINLNPLRLSALGGTVSGKVLLAQMHNLNAQIDLNGFSIASLSASLAGHAIRYGGAISGTVGATADLAQQKSDLALTARLAIAPRAAEGVPVSGHLEAQYQNASGLISLKNSSISLPNSRLDLAGSLNQQVDVTLTSRNLNDFLPAANFGAKLPTTSLPVALKGGTANLEARIQGNLSNPRLLAHAAVTNFAAQQSVFDRLAFDLAASSSGVGIKNGVLSQSTLQSNFDASLGLVRWHPVARSPLSANINLRNAGLDALLAIAGQSSLQASGLLNADVHLNGTYGNPLGAATLKVEDGSLAGQPFTALQAQINATQGLIALDNFSVSSAQGHLAAKGTFRHPLDDVASGHLQLHVNSDNIQLAAIPQLQQDNVAAKGVLNLTADATGDLAKSEFKISNIDANFSANDLSVRNHQSGNLTAVAHTANGAVQYNLKSNFAGSNIAIDGSTSLARDYYTQASAAIRVLPIKDVLEVAGQSDIPATGLFSAQLNFVGTAQAPDAKGNVQISQANFYQEPVDSLNADFHYTAALAELSSLDLKSPAGSISLNGRYTHPAGTKKDSIQLTVRNADFQLAKIKHVQTAEPGLAGALHLAADIAATIDPAKPSSSAVLLSSLNADVAASGLRLSGRNVGSLKVSAHTANSKLSYQLDSDIAQSQIHASGESQLSAGYPSHVGLTFANVRYSNIAPLLNADNDPAQPVDALVEGKVSLNGQLQDFNSLQGRAEITRLAMEAKPRSTVGDARTAPALQNDGPLVVSLNKSILKVEQFRMTGPKTSLDLSGSANFSSASDKLQINLKANTDLAILQDTNRNFYSSGNVSVDAAVGGTLNQPVMNGKIELHHANLNYADAPNGLSNGEGVIVLSGKTATIQNLTGESGGGKITVGGFIGLSPQAVIYNLQATAAKVRTRYSGVSLVSDANLRLTGSSIRSLLSGKVVLQKVGYSSSSDIGSLLSNASVPPATSSSNDSPLLSSIRLDINVSTASDIRVVSSYVEKIDLNSNLQVRGTAAEPGILGHINVANGQLAFFGNSYTINQGSINFYDATAIKPELNLSLETVAQGVDVVLGVTGPVSNMKLSYRSDPPLSFEQIVQLLATNTTPFDPTIAAHQPTPAQQSLSQMGESAVLGQAVANPLASRVQRVFGLSQFKIDPSVAGNNGQPTAKVTLQQKIASNITFTYITDVTQSNSQIIRVQFDVGPKVSAVALRDYNGNVSVEMFYKFQVR